MTFLSHFFDGLTRSHVVLGRRAVPVYLACGLAGAFSGALSMLLLTALTGRSLLVALGLAAVTCACFVGAGLLGRRLFGREQHVLLRDVYMVLFVAALVLAGAGIPIAGYLDLLMIGLCVFLVWGRLGCCAVGCCYGVPAGFGFHYRDRDPDGVRHFPVQLIEAAVWLFLASGGAVMVLRARPGQALAAVLILYGITRIWLEAVRGDRRPHWLGISEGRWLSAAGIGLGLVIYRPPAFWRPVEVLLAASGLALVLLLVATRRVWLDLPPPLPVAVLERAAALGKLIAGTELGDAVNTWSIDDINVGASLHRHGAGVLCVLSISRAAPLLLREEAEHILRGITAGMGVPGPLPPVGVSPGGVFAVAVHGVASVGDHQAASAPGQASASTTASAAEAITGQSTASAPSAPPASHVPQATPPASDSDYFTPHFAPADTGDDDES